MSYEVEKSIIGCILIDEKALDYCGYLTPEMFTNYIFGKIFYQAKEAYDGGLFVDPVLIKDQITDIPEDDVNRAITECVRSSFLSVNIGHYAQSLEKEYQVRTLQKFFSDNEVTEKNMDQIKEQLRVMLDEKTHSGTSRTIEEIANELESQRFVEGRKKGIAIGYSNVDSILNNVHRGDVCIIAARPAVGKSAIVTEIMLNMAKAGHRVALFSLEMSYEQIYDRMIAHESQISLERVISATRIPDPEYQQFLTGNAALKDLKDRLIISDDIYRVSDMYPNMRKADVAVIDYAQLIKPETRYAGNRYAEAGEISHMIKRAAKRFDIPIILLAQLNRVKKEFEEPTMSELRETGDFEQDASQIILMWNLDEDRKRKGVKIDKNRQGKTGTTELMFNGDIMTFTETDEDPFD